MSATMRPQGLFANRTGAGRQLAEHLVAYRGESPIVIGLPRGGVPVAWEVARALDATLDIWIVRKIGAPHNREFGIGAVAEGDELYVNSKGARLAEVSGAVLEALIAKRRHDVIERRALFRQGRPPLDVHDRTVIVVDDGIATGCTARAALSALKRRAPKRLILAAPIASADALESLRADADEIVCCVSETELFAVGAFYSNFNAISDDEVIALLECARARR
jgi:putative phosphoribosyl transferase